MPKKEKHKEADTEQEMHNDTDAENICTQDTEDMEDTQVKTEKTELEKLNDCFLRTVAEYDNYRKRTARERVELEADIKSKIITEILPVFDNLERALSADCADVNYKKGIELIYGSLLETLGNLGVEEINEEDFDPAVHQAIQHVENPELESGKVAQVFQKGYKIGNKVIRFAMVSIVK
ncbi:MAG: nucleotide exchange factor GrpE [Oscillospiraceae bacterium]|nr:nucleotide exchange factor GrpE [Oscillospiraceae bacterium]